jgi:hypothetical protein
MKSKVSRRDTREHQARKGASNVKAIQAIWIDGRIIPSQPVDWPDGTTLTVEPVAEPPGSEITGSMLGNDPASIENWIAAYESLPPLQMTEAEEIAWRDARRDMKEYTLKRMRGLSVEDRS